jgi:tetratricopeptide (TPR) repeat protein
MIDKNINKTAGMYSEITRLISCLLLISFLMLLWGGCDNKSDDKGHATVQENTFSLSDTPLSEFQDNLLDIAFETASLIPLKPHIKDRSKTQERIVNTCLEMDQIVRAIQFAGKIEDWRRGDCFAEIALYSAQKTDTGTMQHCLVRAQEELEKVEETLAVDEIDWRRDRIKLKIEHVSAWQKQQEQLESSPKGMAATEINNPVLSEWFEKQVHVLDALTVTGGFEATKYALASYVELYKRFYANSQYRLSIENEIKSSWEKLPFFARIDLLLKMADAAIKHSELSEALRLINEAQVFIDDYQWPPEKHISLTLRLIALRFRAGDVEKARTDAEGMHRLYDAEREKIVDIYRAGVLRELAEAYQKIGDTQTALKFYKKTIEEGIENPNSRPRAEDLAATCCSMVLNAVEPDTQLWTRIHQIHRGLGQPW